MATLQEILLNEETRPRVVDDCVELIGREVKAKSGLSGLAVKAGYTVVKKLKPGMIREAVDSLLDDFVARLEPFYADFVTKEGKSLESELTGRANDVADALLGVTDERAGRAKNRTIKKAYEKLRPTGVKHTAASVPGLSRVIESYL